MKVADFFCGAGGFSEGFRQAGFEVVFALDKWQPAIDTHNANHPLYKVTVADIEDIAKLPDREFHEIVPDTEVIIGSPPCVAFSNSNKSGKGDKELGKRLVKAYLKIIARKKFKENSILKYWILENVPNLKNHIKDKYTAAELGMNGDFELVVIHENSRVYNAKYFGVASNRKRFICGEFPNPIPIVDDNNVITLGDILQDVHPQIQKQTEYISDPNYCFRMDTNKVTDLHYIYEIQEFEWKKAKRQKQDKGYMGKMTFPESLDKPARTVMATMSGSSREAMIFEWGENKYRFPTVREIASIMSFPLDYIFCGNSIGTKYRLVGNAVPPKMAYAFAKAIANENNQYVPEEYIPLELEVPNNFRDLNYETFAAKEEKRKKDTAKYKYHIPYLIEDSFRVELVNTFKNDKCKWKVEIHRGQGSNAKIYEPRNLKIKEIVEKELSHSIEKYIDSQRSKYKSHSELQYMYILTSQERREKGNKGPDELLESLKIFIVENISIDESRRYYDISEIPYRVPISILIGYYILSEIIKKMKK